MVENFAMLHYSLLQRAPPENHCVLTQLRWPLRSNCCPAVQFDGGPTLPDCRLPSLDAIIARQPGKRRLERIPVNEAAPDHASHIVSGGTPDLVSVPEKAWQTAVKRFEILKPLLNMGNSERTFVHVKKAARALGKHPATVYRWIGNYGTLRSRVDGP